MPDVKIPLDTTVSYYLFNQMIRKSTLVEFAIDYYLTHQPDLKSFTDMNDLAQRFVPNALVYESLIAKAKQQDVKMTDEDVLTSKHIIMTAFKAELAKLLFGDQAYYYIDAQDDKTIEASIELLQ
jgi:hypothetical protein